MIFETRYMTFGQMSRLTKWFDKNIGTEYEINTAGTERYMVAVDLTINEMNKLADTVDHIIDDM